MDYETLLPEMSTELGGFFDRYYQRVLEIKMSKTDFIKCDGAVISLICVSEPKTPKCSIRRPANCARLEYRRD
jgi:hypothetical protein